MTHDNDNHDDRWGPNVALAIFAIDATTGHDPAIGKQRFLEWCKSLNLPVKEYHSAEGPLFLMASVEFGLVLDVWCHGQASIVTLGRADANGVRMANREYQTDGRIEGLGAWHETTPDAAYLQDDMGVFWGWQDADLYAGQAQSAAEVWQASQPSPQPTMGELEQALSHGAWEPDFEGPSTPRED